MSETPFWPRTFIHYVEILAAVSLAISAVVATGEYLSSRRDFHVEQTLNFLERFSSDRLVIAQRDVERIAQTAGAATEERLADPALANLPPAELKVARTRLFVQLVLSGDAPKLGKLPPSIVDITSFFNGLQACIENEVCDEATAHAFFDTYALSFWQVFGAVAAVERSTHRPKFAGGMERFVNAAKAAN